MLTHRIIFEWSEKLMKITKVKNFWQAIIIPTMSKQYHTKTMWKFGTSHMVFGKSIQAHTWSHIKLVKI
jgi:hypothetical protein